MDFKFGDADAFIPRSDEEVDLGRVAAGTQIIATRSAVIDGRGIKLFNEQLGLEMVDGPIEATQHLLRLKDGRITIGPTTMKKIV
jgi:hypothetical protein